MNDELRNKIGDIIGDCVGEYNAGGPIPGSDDLRSELDKIMQLIKAHDTAIRIDEIDKFFGWLYVNAKSEQVPTGDVQGYIDDRLASLQGKGEAEK